MREVPFRDDRDSRARKLAQPGLPEQAPVQLEVANQNIERHAQHEDVVVLQRGHEALDDQAFLIWRRMLLVGEDHVFRFRKALVEVVERGMSHVWRGHE